MLEINPSIQYNQTDRLHHIHSSLRNGIEQVAVRTNCVPVRQLKLNEGSKKEMCVHLLYMRHKVRLNYYGIFWLRTVLDI